ncbi:riboflavin synthase subunit alpha [candidate division WOR-1 bacterium RIFOXYB2_FULL_48_7]|uniref:Riboflavin synthase n=1 Tax=candidate division WOR-1 bacterium RIFOXYB2_FULL_48_7 TaxID=1802583 RepID=A0A1F4T9S4_UNCSA|nr:MAG: riboflavin synthase subunit alpha [candidate division WOR-1 bacterium RIFOXYB2_FULL_48_7]
MFTGIIEQVGIVASLIRGAQAAKIAVSGGKFFDDVKVGDSIAINGVCLTVTHVRRGFAEFDLSQETIKKSTFSDVKIGEKVNMEKALPVAGRLGGHLVTGHIDGVGEIKNKVTSGEGLDFYFSVPSDVLQYLVQKGSVAIDGISLTVADFRDGLLFVSVIPQTVKTTTLGKKGIGDKVNLEVDLISKYIEKHLRGEPRGITEEMMSRIGILPMGWTDN